MKKNEITTKPVEMGHIWIDAFKLINPSEEMRLKIGDMVIKMVRENHPNRVKFSMNCS
jgi:hypothetical protein